MTGHRAYLDHNASSPLRACAREAMAAALDFVGNPSSVHGEGRKARAALEQARSTIADLIGVAPRELVFTSGASESNNAVFALAWTTVITSAIEHDSVLAPAREGSARHQVVPARKDGSLDLECLERLATAHGDAEGMGLISIQAANNETGVIHDLARVGALARHHGFRLHVDAVQALGKYTLDVRQWGADFVSLSAHKAGGPKGVGALVIGDDAPVPNFLKGGGQEMRRRAGTENLAGILGFAAAAGEACSQIAHFARLEQMRTRLEARICEITPGAVIAGQAQKRLANTCCVAVPGDISETLVIALDLAGIAVSAGSACTSGKVARSHVLEAMGWDDTLGDAAIRVSLGWTTTDDEIERFLSAWENCHSTRNGDLANCAA